MKARSLLLAAAVLIVTGASGCRNAPKEPALPVWKQERELMESYADEFGDYLKAAKEYDDAQSRLREQQDAALARKLLHRPPA